MYPGFSFLNQYFDNIYVLTIPAVTDRHELIRKNLKGLDFNFYFGLDKNQVTREELIRQQWYCQDLYSRHYKHPSEMSQGMLCCSIGHMMIYQDMLDKGYDRVLIFEDDIVPDSRALETVAGTFKELPEDWDLFYLGYSKNEGFGIKNKIKKMIYTVYPFHIHMKVNRSFFRNYYPRRISAQMAAAGYHDCLHAYAVTSTGARKLLKHGKPVRMNSDNLVGYLTTTGHLKSYISDKKFFNQLTAFVHQMESLTK